MIKVVIILLLIIIAALLIVGVVDGNRFVVAKQQFVLPNLRKNCRFVMVSDLHNKVYGKTMIRLSGRLNRQIRILSL